MNPCDEFVDIVDRLLAQLKPKSRTSPAELRNAIRALVGAWFQDYQPQLGELLGDDAFLVPIDDLMQNLQKLATNQGVSRRELSDNVNKVREIFTGKLMSPASRAYWQRVEEKPVGIDNEVLSRLKKLDQELARSYEQAVIDLESKRLTYRGPASELREVLTGVLHQLAPNKEVQATDWYKDARRNGTRKEPTPTRSERVKYILRARATSSQEAQMYAELIEERLGLVVGATYAKSSSQTHAGSEAGEVAQQLRYLNALLRDVLPV
jgi:hypothetical protein